MNDGLNDPGVMTLVRHALLRLAADEERMADVEAARVPYWAPLASRSSGIAPQPGCCVEMLIGSFPSSQRPVPADLRPHDSLQENEVNDMTSVIPQHKRFLRDAYGSAITDGACVIDGDREVGYVRLALGPHLRGPESAYWDGWFNVTATRGENPLRGKAMKGDLVELMCGYRS